MAVQRGNKNKKDGKRGDEVMTIRTQLKAGKRMNHNETLQVRSGLQGGATKRRLVVRSGLQAGARLR
jgi:hypothetical protein